VEISLAQDPGRESELPEDTEEPAGNQSDAIDRMKELLALLEADPNGLTNESLQAELFELTRRLNSGVANQATLARSLLAAFVRPNHAEVATLGRDAAERLGRSTGDPSFSAFQREDVAEAEARVEATVTAIYDCAAPNVDPLPN